MASILVMQIKNGSVSIVFRVPIERGFPFLFLLFFFGPSLPQLCRLVIERLCLFCMTMMLQQATQLDEHGGDLLTHVLVLRVLG